MQHPTKMSYVITTHGHDFALCFRPVKEGDIKVANFEEGKRLMRVLTADLVTHYQIICAAWSNMTEHQWVAQTKNKNKILRK